MSNSFRLRIARIGKVWVWLVALYLFTGATFVLPAAGQTAASTSYKLGYEDVVVVTVVGKPEFSGEFYIPSEGKVNFPGVGEIFLTGKSIDALSKELTAAFEKRLQNPEVYLTLKVPRPQRVYVMGVVGRPGLFDLKPGWRVTEALGAAGGVISGIPQSDCTVNLLRSSNAKQTVSLADVMQGLESANLALNSGDVVTVESVETIPVYVVGKVSRPGLISMRKDNAGLGQALTIAGGIVEGGALSKVTITHLTGDTETVDVTSLVTEGRETTPVKLLSGDLVAVPDSNARFAILGLVNQPGVYVLKEGQVVTLSDAIAMAKGADIRRSGMRRIGIVRNVNGKQERIICDYTKFVSKADITQNPIIRSGDMVWVPETNAIDWDRWMSRLTQALSAWYYADTVTKRR